MNELVLQVQQRLDDIKHVEDDFEYWSARELMGVLGYKKWQAFYEVLKKAKDACLNSGQHIEDHFTDVGKMIKIATGTVKETTREVQDVLLTRYACYLIAQNGDPRKIEIAYSQTYFAVQTRRQELLEQRVKEDKRLEARERLKNIETVIEETVYHRGITYPQEFATFKNKHIEALCGGMGTSVLKKKRNIPEHRALADFDTELELSAKHFSLAMTDHNIKKHDLRGKPRLENEVVKNGKATRQTLLSRGIRPEILEPEEDLKKIEKRREKERLGSRKGKLVTK